MNFRVVAISLLVLVACLVGAVAFLAYLLTTGPTSAAGSPTVEVRTNVVTKVSVRKVNATNLIPMMVSTLTWSRIESTNYVTYMANLKQIGCPDETIRDIVLADIAKLYARRRAEIRKASAPSTNFWQAPEVDDPGSAGFKEFRRQIKELEREQSTLVRELLGLDFEREMAKWWDAEDYRERMVNFLPAAKQQQVRTILAKYDDLERDQDSLHQPAGYVPPADPAQAKALEAQMRAELAQVLSAQELTEYDLRNSSTAQSLRGQLAALKPTEDEFRKIFTLQQQFDEIFVHNSPIQPRTPEEHKRLEDAQQEAKGLLDQEIKATIGEQRFAEYQRAQDPDFSLLRQMTQQLELAEDAPGKVYNMKRQALEERAKVETNPNLDAEQRRRALEAIMEETTRSIADVLGPKGYAAYSQADAAGWIPALGAAPTAPATTPESETGQVENQPPPPPVLQFFKRPIFQPLDRPQPAP